MVITADHLVAIVFELLLRYRNSPYDLDKPQVVAELIVEEYNITKVLPSRFTYDELCREIVPPSHFVRMSPANPNVGQSFNAVRPESRDDYLRARAGHAPPPDPSAAPLAALSLFSSNPVAALAFINGVSLGYSQSEAIRQAQSAGNIADLFLLTRSGMVAHSRAVSSTTGRPRDVYRQNLTLTDTARAVIAQPANGTPIWERDAPTQSQQSVPLPRSLSPGPRRPVPPPLSTRDLRRRLAEEVSRDRARHGARLRDIRN